MTQEKKPVETNLGMRRGRFSDRYSGTSKPKNLKQVVKRLWSYFKGEKKILSLLGIAVVAQTLLGLCAPYLIGKWIDQVDRSLTASKIDLSFGILLTLLAVYVCSALFLWSQGRMVAGVSQRMIKTLRTDLMNKLSKLPIQYFDTHAHGDIMSRFTNDVDSVSTTITESLSQLVAASLTVTGSLTMMFILSWQLSLAALTVTPLIFILTRSIAKFARPLFKKRAVELGKMTGIVEESVGGLQLIQSFNRSDQILEEFTATSKRLMDVGMKAQITVGFLMPMMNVITNLSFAIIALAGGALVIKGVTTIGIVASFITYSRQFIRPLNEIASVYSTIQQALAGGERLIELLDELEEQSEEGETLDLDASLDVVFENVSFGYDKDKAVLKGMSFKVPPGKKIALVGPTGAGKTTVVNLLARFYEAQSGDIKIGNTSIKNYSKESLYQAFGIVLQDAYLFAGTVKENICYGNMAATMEDVVLAAEQSCADHFINKLPLKYETQLTSGGMNLSQGERQLITIARAIAANPRILILDEATSNVDTRTEKIIQQGMLRLMKGRTSFIIAHRLSTIRDADTIMVIDKGEIIEVGDHAELMEKKGHYHTMVMHQYNNEPIE
ncbi:MULTISPECIES: ABC transporter ATP-binding protein [unclassified Fusibacter]|uniref:ABC transporter ATP-binding protein n=1 Tax=unclassified Fusibacter TaxID=2624464 RepID=UPI001013374D|nr:MULTISPECIES: ABC transporter ATP-binding protein [unclassified Fusibacter]MCK8060013.1 ABC transporter ATP-binding protein/permease [Fusibacter sp. A2]NPE22153.1 ABC transporter ATP-binding protein [Fusibacter sp. A1]RXV60930.1 ABC transporter ATP-binding protein [Fusibacter sp. A1]